jgi:hypothetical protein
MHSTRKLFRAVKIVAAEDGKLPFHYDDCNYPHKNVPLNEATCDCAEFYWFLQGLHMTQAECSVKLSEIQPTDSAEIVEKEFRTKRLGDSDWSDWTQI